MNLFFGSRAATFLSPYVNFFYSVVAYLAAFDEKSSQNLFAMTVGIGSKAKKKHCKENSSIFIMNKIKSTVSSLIEKKFQSKRFNSLK